MHGFPKKSDPKSGAREEFAILYRIDYDRHRHSLTLYIQSEEQPNWKFPEGYLQPTYPEETASIQIIPFELTPEALSKGRELKFSLRANPTKKIDTKTGPDGKKRNGRRVPLIKQEDLKKWILKKGQDHGFELVNDTISIYVKSDVVSKNSKGVKVVNKDGEKKVFEITLQGVIFSGTLRITDPEKFIDAVRNGIGQGKAFGFGLLLLRA